jgi:hypothetical protein
MPIAFDGRRMKEQIARLLRAVEAKALELGCCKITLEVQQSTGVPG